MDRWLIVLCVACSHATPPPPPPAAPTVVSDEPSAKALVGHPAEVHGTARDAMLGPVILLGDRTPIYCLGASQWPDGKQVVAHGKLELTDEFAAKDPASSGTSGPVYVLRACEFKPL